MWAHEVMPTDLRAQGVSISRCIGHLVKIPANYIAFEVRLGILSPSKRLFLGCVNSPPRWGAGSHNLGKALLRYSVHLTHDEQIRTQS